MVGSTLLGSTGAEDFAELLLPLPELLLVGGLFTIVGTCTSICLVVLGGAMMWLVGCCSRTHFGWGGDRWFTDGMLLPTNDGWWWWI